MRLETLLKSLPKEVEVKAVHAAAAVKDLEISDICYDSRHATPGSLFVALSGERSHGEDFITNAVRAGSQIIVCENHSIPDLPQNVCVVEVNHARTALAFLAHRFFDDPTRKFCLIGVTGTNGKTTTTYILEAILKAAGFKTGVIGTVNYRYGGKLIPADRTTPEAVDLCRMFAEMQRSGVTHVVMEVSSHALVQQRVLGCEWDGALITNITQDHLDFHKTMDEYVRAKEQLFLLLEKQVQGRTPGAKGAPVAVFNFDNPLTQKLALKFEKRRILSPVTSGFAKDADIRPDDLKIRVDGCSFAIESDLAPEAENTVAEVALTGRHNIENVLGAVALALELGVEWSTVVDGLKKMPQVPGRLERLDSDYGVSVFVDYAHTDDALTNVLLALEQIKQVGGGRIITVFGCGGDRDRTKRPRMGRAVVAKSDIAIVTSDNPRTEDPKKIIADIVAEPTLNALITSPESHANSRAHVVENRREAIRLALQMAKPNDLVLIAGKGHENYQEIQGVKHPFSDLQVARELAQEAGWKIRSV